MLEHLLIDRFSPGDRPARHSSNNSEKALADAASAAAPVAGKVVAKLGATLETAEVVSEAIRLGLLERYVEAEHVLERAGFETSFSRDFVAEMRCQARATSLS